MNHDATLELKPQPVLSASRLLERMRSGLRPESSWEEEGEIACPDEQSLRLDEGAMHEAWAAALAPEGHDERESRALLGPHHAKWSEGERDTESLHLLQQQYDVQLVSDLAASPAAQSPKVFVNGFQTWRKCRTDGWAALEAMPAEQLRLESPLDSAQMSGTPLLQRYRAPSQLAVRGAGDQRSNVQRAPQKEALLLEDHVLVLC